MAENPLFERLKKELTPEQLNLLRVHHWKMMAIQSNNMDLPTDLLERETSIHKMIEAMKLYQQGNRLTRTKFREAEQTGNLLEPGKLDETIRDLQSGELQIIKIRRKLESMRDAG
ncbi:MAG: hypothetical protein ABIG96_01415 [Candidatus Micrarchaeota archaeon]